MEGLEEGPRNDGRKNVCVCVCVFAVCVFAVCFHCVCSLT